MIIRGALSLHHDKELAIGGGRGTAIFIGQDMLFGRSEPCETFGSPQLTMKDQFKIVELEAWRLAGTDIAATRSHPG
jgi:hypothetical protein